MISGKLDRNRREQVATDGGRSKVHRNYIITSQKGLVPSPQAYLVEQPHGVVLRTHYHLNSQFQVFVTGKGTIGRHAAQPYVVQYADRQSGYGPITPSETGLEYLALRPTTVPSGAQYLPETRDQMEEGLRRRTTVSEAMAALPGSGQSEVRTMIESTPDGLGAWFMHLPGGADCDAPALDNGKGRFYIVVEGQVDVGNEHHDALSVLWTDAGEAPLHLKAMNTGADVIVLQFPESAY